MTDDTILQNLTLVEDLMWVVTRPTRMGQYDFHFEDFFACRHPIHREGRIRAVARMGAAEDYDQRYRALSAEGIDLIHTPLEYSLTSHLPHWYPLISDLTPRSQWFDCRPTVDEIESQF